VFENRVLRRIFGPKRDEVTGEWRKLHSEELHISGESVVPWNICTLKHWHSFYTQSPLEAVLITT
jgi:hypothetical protein